jgi:hypothetical protein
MSASAQYTSSPKFDNAVVLTADTSLTQPANATVGIPFTAGRSGGRIDNIFMSAVGTTVAAQLRLFVCKGTPGQDIVSITSLGTVATVTTVSPHGMVTGDLATFQDMFPVGFNVKASSITVTSPTTFTYIIPNLLDVSPTRLGYYTSTPVAPLYSLLKEVPITATTPSASVSAFNMQLTTMLNPELLPIILPPGYSLRANISVTQTGSGINISGNSGDF